MKLQFIYNKVNNSSLANLGVADYISQLKSIGYTVELSFKTINKTFTTYQFSSDVVGNATSVNQNELIPFMEDGNRLTIFILGSDSSNPHQSNPVQYPVNKNGNTIIVIPEHWYGLDQTTLSMYLLHETAHAGFFFANKKDTVHTPPDKYGSIVDGNRVYYIDLLKELKPILDTTIVKSYPVLKNGSRGDAVKELQTLLGIKADGIFGRNTETAVKIFQKTMGLVSDGIVGKLTWLSLHLKKKPSVDWGLLPEVQAKAEQLIRICLSKGYAIKITSGYRSQAEQNLLYAQGRTDKTKPIVTWTKNSKHCKGLAFDYCFQGSNPYPKDDNIWKAVADIGVSIGLKAGYYFKKNKDRPHFEL